MKVSKFLSSYLKAADITQPVDVVIDRAEEESFEREGEEQTKLVVYLKGYPQGVVLSKTTINQLVDILGSDDSDNWAGRSVTMFSDPTVLFCGKRVGGIRFRACASK